VGRHQDRPKLQVRLRRWGSTVILELQGRLIVEARVQPLGDLTEWMTCRGQCRLLLDMSGVLQMDCSGIGQIVGLHQKVRRLGGGLALINVSPRQKRLLDVAGLLAILPVFDCPRTALSSRFNDYDVA
jgi:stage II sporulation protein AA (anti-sigma F factor antagonist)